MNVRINLKLLAVALGVVAILLIWTAGEGGASQERQRGFVSGQDFHVQAADPQQEEDQSTPKRSMMYYTKLMTDIAYQIHNRYMEDVDTEELIEAGINGMLEELDPYSVLFNPKSYDTFLESTQGKYEGVGMQIGLRDDRVTIISPIEGTPAYRLGLQAGDRIMMIDSVSTDGMSTEDAAELMRGPAGTIVNLTIARPGVEEWLEYEVERALIELKSVRYYGIVEDDIGYVRLDKFSRETTEDLAAALRDMLDNMGAKSIILDLRFNGGGFLDQAVGVANLFLPKEKLIVYTQGKYPTSQKKYLSRSEPVFPEGGLVVLVNGGTASASEIVSGAIQDWDRGVVIGSNTFGKGLVQEVFPAPDFTLKLTTAKYYIPSGRCIQKPERATKHPEELEPEPITLDSEADEVDTEREVYLTAAGREVYGGGGIVPDVKIEEETWQPIEYNLVRKNMFFDFAVDYTTLHPELPVDFEVTDEMVEEFRRFIKEEEFDYKTAFEYDLERFEQTAEKAEVLDKFAADLDDIRRLIDEEKAKDFDESIDFIRRTIKREIVRKLGGERGVYEEYTLKVDKGVLKAVEILKDKEAYSELLRPKDNQG